ncbi:MAG: discoidin domain-containing protein [Clostridia bacterium]|nr:discoidin domain-containing protein [Clostridia bacterium]
MADNFKKKLKYVVIKGIAVALSACVLTQSLPFNELKAYNVVNAAWDGYTDAEIEEFSPLDFNKLSDIMATGGIPSNEYAKNGNRYSVYWGNHLTNTDLSFGLSEGSPSDWSDFLNISLDIYSKKATKATIMFIVYSPDTAVVGNYFYKNIIVDWEGWKSFKFKQSEFSVSREATWKNVSSIRFVGHGNWGITGNSETELYVSSIRCKKGDPTSSMDFYGDSIIEQTYADLKDSVAVYGNGVNAVSDNGAKYLGYEIDHVSKTTTVPAELFKVYFNAGITDNGKNFSVALGENTVSGEVGKTVVKVNGEEHTLSLAPYAKGGKVFFPGEEVAKLLGKQTYTDGRLLVIGTSHAVESLMRPEHLDVNEKNEVASYMAFHRPVNLNEFSPEDTVPVKDNWRRYLVGSEEINDMSDPDIAAQINSIDADGKKAWNSMIKTSGSKELFEGITSTASSHMTSVYSKLYKMALAWATNGTSLYKNEDLKKDIIYGLKWGHENRYGNSSDTKWTITGFDNWWDWDIGVPQYLMQTMLLLEDELTPELIKKYCAYFDSKNPMPKLTGGNYTDIAKSVLISALLQNDYKRVVQTRSDFEKMYLYVDDNERITESQLRDEERRKITPMKGAGFFTDGSYILHTLHAMNATYGPAHFEPLCMFEKIFAGTAFETNTPFRYNVPEVFYNVFNSVIYGTTTYRHVMGRSDPVNNFNTGSSLIAAAFSAADKFDPEDRDKIYGILKASLIANPNAAYPSKLCLEDIKKYKEIIADESIKPLEDISENRVFYNMDKVVHKRNDWSVGISMSSSRIFNYESINQQNMTGWYLGDGRTEWYLYGDNTNANASYWSSIDPYRYPGTTVDTQQRKAVCINQGNEYLSSKDYVGGVSLDKTFGVAAMELESYHFDKDFGEGSGVNGGKAPAHQSDLVAKKSYFMFDDEFVALGSGVNAKANNDAEVLTIVDNLLAQKTESQSGNAIIEPYAILSATASATPEAENVAANTIDADMGTKWAGKLDHEIVFDLGEEKELGFIVFSFMSGSSRKQNFILELSNDGTNYIKVFEGSSSGKKDSNEAFDLEGRTARYIKFINKGNSAGSEWVSLCDAKVYPVSEDGTIGVQEDDIFGADKIVIDGSVRNLAGDDVIISGSRWLNIGDKCGYVFPQTTTDNMGDLKMRWTNGVSSHFELWFSHGVNPTDGRYEYIVLPGKTEAETKAYYEARATKVLINNEKIQAVKDTSIGTTGIVFWEAGALDRVTVSAPLIVMYRETDTEFRIAVSDPTQKLTDAQVTINLPLELIDIDDRASSKSDANTTTLTLNLNGSDGRSFEAVYQKK